MANSILTIDKITRESLRVLHAQSNFIGSVNRQYDSNFAVEGAKIGDTLRIRKPSKYTTRSGRVASVQDHVETNTSLQVSNQIGVDVEFTSKEMSMDLDTLSSTVLVPAMSQLASSIESDCANRAYKMVPNTVGATGEALTYKKFQQAGARLTKSLAPLSDRYALLTPDSRVEFTDAVKGLFQDSSAIGQQYREGTVGKTGGFVVRENTLLPVHTSGTLAGTPLTNGASLGTTSTDNVHAATSTIAVDGATANTTLRAGDVITFGTVAAGVVDVHAETKQSLGVLKQFVVQADVTLAGGAGNVVVAPAMISGSGNAFQNCVVTSTNTDGLAVAKVDGAGADTFQQDLFFHKDAFVFATADLIDPSLMGARAFREVMDGISMRVVQQYDATNDVALTRFDVLYGFGPLYAEEFAVRHIHD